MAAISQPSGRVRYGAPDACRKGRGPFRNQHRPKVSERRRGRRQGISRCCPFCVAKTQLNCPGISCLLASLCPFGPPYGMSFTGSWFKASEAAPFLRDLGVLPCSKVRAYVQPAWPQKFRSDPFRISNPLLQRAAGHLAALKAKRCAGPALCHSCAVLVVTCCARSTQLQADEIALAIRHLKPDTDGTEMFGGQGTLLSNDPPLGPCLTSRDDDWKGFGRQRFPPAPQSGQSQTSLRAINISTQDHLMRGGREADSRRKPCTVRKVKIDRDSANGGDLIPRHSRRG
jgi:hypothetical protein